MKSQAEALEKAEKYYSKLAAGKSLEKRVSLAVSRYAVNRNEEKPEHIVKITTYTPEIDMDGVDFIFRIETKTFVQLLEVQVKSAKTGIQVSPSLIEMSRKYELKAQAFVIVCASDPENLDDLTKTRCFHSWDVNDLTQNGAHISSSLLDSFPSFAVVLDTIIEAIS